MTRPFYTDPLAAAWMAKHFGMKFDPMPQPVTYSFQHDDVYPREHGGANYRIHVDSLHLLEPKARDLVFVDNQHGSEYWDEVRAIVRAEDEAYSHNWDGRPIMVMDCGQHDYFDKLQRIILRNGIAFHWPESKKA